MKIAVGMSGGVDSTTVAKMLKEEGHEVVGFTMLLWNGDKRAPKKNSCYSEAQKFVVEEAEKYAKDIGIEYHALDVSKYFEKYVVDYVVDTYKAGLTPNPCVTCNSVIKFGALFNAIELSGFHFDKFATGHYAGINYNEITKRYELLRGKNIAKDQSYFLYRLTQKQLSKIIFPMYEKTKEEVREIAKNYGLTVYNKSESQDFFAGEYYRLFEDVDVKEDTNSGEIKLLSTGETLAHHNGIWNYTIGQRKGLGIAYKEPLYVVKIDASLNTVFVDIHQYSFTKTCKINNINFVSMPDNSCEDSNTKEFSSLVKTRSSHKGSLAKVTLLNNNEAFIEFNESTSSVAPGQSCVCYDGNKVLLGGIIV